MKIDEKAQKALAHEMRHCNGSMDYARVALEWLQDNGYVKLPAEWYIAEDGDGDPSIWRPNPLNEHAAHTCLGIRFMAGNAQIEKPVADWLWENIRKGES